MGRARTKRKDLPERVYHRKGAYYFVHKATGKWERLDSDYAKAMAKWSTLVVAPAKTETMGNLFDRYLLEVVPHKAERTQKDNRQELRFLRAVMGAVAYAEATGAKVAPKELVALLKELENAQRN